MSDYGRVTASIEASAYDNFADPYLSPPGWVKEITPDEVVYSPRIEAALTSGTAINTSILTTCSLLMVRNLDTQNYVDLVWRSAANSTTDNKVRIQPGDMFVTQDVTAATNPTITADTAACLCEVVFAGT